MWWWWGKESFAIIRAEEVQLRSTEITGYVINETAVFRFCLNWRSRSFFDLGENKYNMCNWMLPRTCLLSYDKMIPELWLFLYRVFVFPILCLCLSVSFSLIQRFICFRLYASSRPPFNSIYIVEQLQTAHRPAVASPLSVAGRRVVVERECVGERAAKEEKRTRTCHWNQQSGSSSLSSTWDVGLTTQSKVHKSPATELPSSTTKPILPAVLNPLLMPSRRSSTPTSLFGGRSNCFSQPDNERASS